MIKKYIFLVFTVMTFLFCFGQSVFAEQAAELDRESVKGEDIIYISSYKNGGYVGSDDMAVFSAVNLDGYWEALGDMDFIDYLYERLMAHEQEIMIDSYFYDRGEMNILEPMDFKPYFEAVLNLHPDLFFVGVYYEYYILPDGTIDSFVPDYLYSADEQAEIQKQIDAEADRAMSYIKDGMTDADKALVIHEYFNNNYSYDYEGLNDDSNLAKFTMAQLFIDKTAVCQGFSYGYKYIMDKLGIPCDIVQSYSMQHIWNQIQLSEGAENWYHIDTTNDNTMTDDAEGRSNRGIFLISDSKLKASALGDVPYNSYEPDGRAADVSYENLGLTDGLMNVSYADGYWYYSTNSGTIARCSLASGQKEELASVAADWRCTGGGGGALIGTVFTVPSVYNGMIYYNTSTQIRRYNPADGSDTLVADMPEGVVIDRQANVYRCIYDLKVSDNGVLSYTIADNDSLEGKKTYQVSLDGNNKAEVIVGPVNVSGSAVSVDVENDTPDSCRVRLAYYDESGRFISSSSAVVAGGEEKRIEGTMPAGAHDVSAFVWNNMMEPQCRLFSYEF